MSILDEQTKRYDVHFNALQLLLEYLEDRVDKPVATQKILTHFGFKRRELQVYIRDLRKAGNPIISGEFGYMYTKDVDKLKRFMLKINSAATDMLNTANILRRVITNIESNNGSLF